MFSRQSFESGSPRDHHPAGISASSSLNAVIAAKREAEAKAKADKLAEEKARKAAIPQVTLNQFHGWSNHVDASSMNAETEAAKPVPTSPSSAPISSLNAEHPPVEDAGAHPVPMPPHTHHPSRLSMDSSVQRAGGAGSPAQRAPEGVEGKDWWKKMDQSVLNAAEEEKPKAGGSFVPQLMGGSGLCNRLVPLDAPSPPKH